MTTCQKLRDLTSSAPERAAELPPSLEAHVATCLACQAEVHASRRLAGLLDAAHDDAALAPRAAERAIARWESERRATASAGWHALRVPVALAAGALVAVGVMWALDDPAPEPASGDAGIAETGVPTPTEPMADTPAPPERLEARACARRGAEAVSCTLADRFETGAGERLGLELSDGTAVELDHDTAVRLDPEAERGLVLEHGTILLDVVRQDGLPPLTIGVPTGEVRVIGTQLQVSASDSRALVDVLRGEVEVVSAGEKRRMGAGDEAILRDEDAPRVYAAPDLAEATRWIEPIDERGETDSLGFGSLSARKPGAKQDSEAALRLVDHRVTARLQGRVARTTVEEAFHNDTDDVLEGVYTFPIPPGARIAALDLMVDGVWEHGAIVDRERGDKIWAGVIRNAAPKKKKRQIIEYIWVPGPWKDPALLTWKQGSEFELRIFPIPARSERRVRIAYTETLAPVPGGRRYAYPLPKDPTGRARAEHFAFHATVGGVAETTDVRTAPYDLDPRAADGRVSLAMRRDRFAPDGDIVVDVPDPEPGVPLTTWSYRAPTGDAYALLALRPHLPARASEGPLDLLFVVDTSYSTQGERLERAARVVARAVREVGPGHRAHVLACATRCHALGPGFRATGEGLAREIEERLRAVEPLGTTALDHTFAEAAAVLRRAGADPGAARVVYVGDGMPTIGELDAGRIASGAAEILSGVRVTTVSLGGQVDAAMLEGIAGATDGDYLEYGRFRTPRAMALAILQRQWGQPLTDVRLALPGGLSQVAPAAQAALWPGEERLVTARLGTHAAGEVVLTGTLGGEPFERRYRIDLSPSAAAGNAFLPRLWAERRIADLEATDAAAHRDEIVALSKAHHVVSRHTSLLVLESPAMAKAFGVEDTRPAVDWTGEEQAQSELADAFDTFGGEDEDGEGAFGVISTGTMGRSGMGMGGGGSGSGVGKLDDLAHNAGGANRRMAKARSSRPQPAKTRPRPAQDPAPKPFPREDRDTKAAEKRPAPATVAPPPPRRGGQWVAMKKVWYREATITGHRAPRAADHRELAQREAHLAQRPDSRDRTRGLVRWYLRLGMVTSAEQLAQRWLARDRLDAEALLALADVAALQGDAGRAEALLASAVEVDHRNLAAQDRLAALYRAANEPALACAHATARALLDPTSFDHVVAAARCTGDAPRHLARLSRSKRRKADKALAKAAPTPRVKDRITVDATWSGGADLDIVVLDPKGRRVSWQGGAKRVAVAEAKSRSHEKLALSADALGRYQILVVHADAIDDPDVPAPEVTGSVTVRSYNGARRTLPFTTDGSSARVASLRVQAKWRHEPVR